jgi:Spy/CpxP family protein refolding chaperone
MNAAKSLFLAVSIIAASAMLTAAQVIIELKPKAAEQPTTSSAEPDPNDLVNEVFSPITGALNLTPNQQFRIATIATATMLQAEPLFQQLDELDGQLSEAAFTGRLDEVQIKQLSERQAALLSQIIAMKARAKIGFNKVLTAEQRAMVAEQFRIRSIENSLGSISN